MTTKERLILVQKQLKIARRALEKINHNESHTSTAQNALDEIDQIQFAQIGA